MVLGPWMNHCMVVPMKVYNLKWQLVCKFGILERIFFIDFLPSLIFLYITRVSPIIFFSKYFTQKYLLLCKVLGTVTFFRHKLDFFSYHVDVIWPSFSPCTVINVILGISCCLVLILGPSNPMRVLNGAAAEVWDSIDNFIPHYIVYIITYPGWDLSSSKLTHWGRVTHICVSKLTIIDSDDGLSPGRRQAIIWTNAGIMLLGPLQTKFSEILIKIHTSSFKKMHLKMSSGKCRPSCLGLNVLNKGPRWPCCAMQCRAFLIPLSPIFKCGWIKWQIGWWRNWYIGWFVKL